MPLDLSKPSLLVNDSGSTPQLTELQLTYRVAQPKGRIAQARAKLSGKIDLDATLLLFNARNEVVSVTSPEDANPFGNQAAYHTGDAMASAGGSATETIQVQLTQIPRAIEGMILAVVSYGNAAAMGKLAQLVFTLVGDGAQLAQDYLNIERGVEGNLLVKIVRSDRGGWTIEPFVRSVQRTADWRQLADAARGELTGSRRR